MSNGISSPNPEGFHYREILMRDGEPEIIVLASKFGAFDWPRTINFDEKTWYFATLDALLAEEASNYGGKAIYKLTQATEQEDRIINVNPQLVQKVVRPTQYFVVGATWDGVNMLPLFLKRGYWQNGYQLDKPQYNKVVEQMNPGDRIAVKKLCGQGSTQISIHALGIITDVDSDGYTVYVKWVLQIHEESIIVDAIGSTEIVTGPRLVEMRGCMGTAAGPYFKTSGDSWIQRIFSI